MHRRSFLQALAAGFASSLPAKLFANTSQPHPGAVSVDQLPQLEGALTLYLGRGEGGLYENILDAIRKRNPKLDLKVRRGTTAALANTIIAESKAGVRRADLFWAVDSGAIGAVTDAGLGQAIPGDMADQLRPGFKYSEWTPITGRIRTLPFNTERLTVDQIPDDIMALADSDISIAWAPAYASFQSFLTAMRLLEGDKVTAEWLKGVSSHARSYAGELGVVMAVERGEVDLGFANHYYTLRLKAGKPNANLDLAFTRDDAGCLVNASGVVVLSETDLATNFVRYLLSKEVQSYLANEAYEIPLINGVTPPPGLPDLAQVSPPQIDLTQLADLRPTLNLMRRVGVL